MIFLPSNPSSNPLTHWSKATMDCILQRFTQAWRLAEIYLKAHTLAPWDSDLALLWQRSFPHTGIFPAFPMDPSNMSSASLLRSCFFLVRQHFAVSCESKSNSLSYFKALYRNLHHCNPFLIFHGRVVARILSRNSRPSPLCCFMWLISSKDSVTAMKTRWEFLHLRALGPSFVIMELCASPLSPQQCACCHVLNEAGPVHLQERRGGVFLLYSCSLGGKGKANDMTHWVNNTTVISQREANGMIEWMENTHLYLNNSVSAVEQRG